MPLNTEPVAKARPDRLKEARMNGDGARGRKLYLDLLKKILTRYVTGDGPQAWEPPLDKPARPLYDALVEELSNPKIMLVRRVGFDPQAREEGRDWPAEAETMIGLKRLDNLQECIEQVLADEVPGDLLEAGVWRGGAGILMRGVLEAHGVRDRIVWLADSFAGLPKPDPERYPADAGDRHWTRSELAVSRGTVEANFERYGLLDDRVRFLEGWFRDTLPKAPMESIAVLRVDGDMYESTIVALDSLYPKVPPGGFVIVDDYGAIEQCRKAVDDFRSGHAIPDPMESIDWTGVYWRRSA